MTSIKTLIYFLCVLYCTVQSEGGPLRRRSVSEVQLMHNLGEHRHLQERQDWIQTKLREIHTATLKGGDGWQKRRTRTLLPEDTSGLEDFTTNEMQYLLHVTETPISSQ